MAPLAATRRPVGASSAVGGWTRPTGRRVPSPVLAGPETSGASTTTTETTRKEAASSPQAPPRLSGALPLLGHGLLVARLQANSKPDGLTSTLAKAEAECGPVFNFAIGTNEVFCVNDPELVAEVTIKKSDRYNQRYVPGPVQMNYKLPEAGYKEEAQGGGCPMRGIVFTQGAYNGQQRGMALKALSRPKTRAYIESIVEDKAGKLCERWGEGIAAAAAGHLDLRVDLEATAYTSDVIAKATLSVDLGQLEAPLDSPVPEFISVTNSILQATSDTILSDPLGLYRFFDTKTKTDLRKGFTWMVDFEEGLIADRRAALEAGEPPVDDYLGMLLEAKDEAGEPLPLRDIRWSVHDMFIAGNDTTASTIAAALALLALHPGVQEELRRELRQVCPDGSVPRASQMDGLPLLDAIVKETLRLYPAANIFARVLDEAEDDVLGGQYIIPGGSTVFMTPYLMQRSPRYWTSPESFDPSRFMPGGEYATGDTPRGAWMPFGMGTRNCVGGQLAILEARTVIASLVQSFSFSPVPERDTQNTGINPDGSLNITYTITMTYPDGVTLRVTPLDK